MSSSGQSQGASGSQVEEAEDEESSSSSSLVPPDELESFREKWKQDLAVYKGNQNLDVKLDDEPDSIEEKARQYFLQGVEHEQNGELFEAIQKYRKAVALVPDIEFKTFEHTKTSKRRPKKLPKEETIEETDDAEEVPDLPEDHDDEEEFQDLLLRFSKMKLKGSPLCEPESSSMTTSSAQTTHISSLPMELIIYILKWVVSTELDLKSLENFSQVCRGFFVASRASDIWRLVCVQTWGLAGLPMEEPGIDGWRTLFITRPRVNFNGCYISRMTYLREGERGFQDSEHYKSWHVVYYHRLIRFFAGGQVIMVTTSENPATAVKLLTSRSSCAIQGCMFGHYRTVNNRVICVLQKPKHVEPKRRMSLRQRKAQKAYVFEVPDQDFHFEMEIKGQRNQHLQWLCYNVISKYKNGREQVSEIRVSDPNNYPNMHFSRVKSYTSETFQPLQ